MGQSSLIKKLRIKAGQRLLVLNAPSSYLESLGELPEGTIVTSQPEGVFDFVQLFVKNRAEYEQWGATAVAAVKYDGLFWLCYPKQSSRVETDLSRDMMWQLVEGTGLRAATQIAIDEVWSALRYRPSQLVGR
jgi:hypothetical protein